ncbi:MAG: hypothetical protein H6755_03250 [Candidatus Omnitrophica bacterium]|nr:hypothetical protein [Candidatus Omnitrophota bacterium]MCB9747403.1 hypothetical protein [Candidatus Omnitrophota bacterium]
MERNLIFKKRKKRSNPDEILKVTALVYLKDALATERFEECAELIVKAKEFGADPSEINSIITRYVDQVRTSLNSAADNKAKNRLPI